MRLRRPRQWWRLLHFCGWDRTCRSVHAPWYLHFHFLDSRTGGPVRVDLSPPWVRRRQDAWFASLKWQNVNRERGD